MAVQIISTSLPYNTSGVLGQDQAFAKSVSIEGTRSTYATQMQAISNATAATDVFMLQGSATKTVRIWRAAISGYATAATGVLFYAAKRTAAPSGQTSAAITAIAKYDTAANAPTAAPVSITVSGTLGAGNIVNVRHSILQLPATVTLNNLATPFTWGGNGAQAIVLRGTSEYFVLGVGTAAAGTALTAAGAIFFADCEWSEE